MGKETAISWTHHTFNVVLGCEKVSPGCKNCYAESGTRRLGKDIWGPGRPRETLSAAYWRKPLRWNREAEQAGERRRVFCGSWCDVFEDHPTVAAERAKLWPLIRETPWLDWLLLTKRAERIASCLPSGWPLPNVWLGVSVESAEYAWRADYLRKIDAAVRFVSHEPALGPLAPVLSLDGIDWLIYGGESGPLSRPHDAQWARDMRRKCDDAGVAFFYKQSPGRQPETDPFLDGESIQEYPHARWLMPLFKNSTDAERSEILKWTAEQLGVGSYQDG